MVKAIQQRYEFRSLQSKTKTSVFLFVCGFFYLILFLLLTWKIILEKATESEFQKDLSF